MPKKSPECRFKLNWYDIKKSSIPEQIYRPLLHIANENGMTFNEIINRILIDVIINGKIDTVRRTELYYKAILEYENPPTNASSDSKKR